MALFKRRKKRVSEGPGVTGTVRHHRALDDLSGIRPGDIVVIDAVDLDAEPAQALVDVGIVGVINVSSTASGRFPAQGALVLANAGIAIVDEVGSGMWNAVRSGEVVRLDGGSVHYGDAVIATGLALTAERALDRYDEASSGLSNQLDAVVTNATDILRRDRDMLIDGERIPALTQQIEGRPVVIVSDHPEAAHDLKILRHFIIDHDPVMVGVGAGANLLLKRGYGLDVLVGEGEDLDPEAIAKADEIILISGSGRWERPERFEKHGRQPLHFTATGTASDLALLLLDNQDPAVIVLVGSPRTLTDVVDRDPIAVAGTFVARLRASSRIVDAEAVEYFMRQRIGWLAPTALLLCGVVAVLVALATTAVGSEWLAPLTDTMSTFISWIEGFFS